MLKIIGRTLLVLLVVAVLAIGYVVYQLFSQFKKFDQVKLTNTTEVYDTLRFTYSRSGHILVEVAIEQTGKKYPFIMDSGASSFLFENKADEFELASDGQALVINSGGSFLTAPIKKVGAIQIGTASFDDFTVKLQTFHSDCGNEAYGLLGKDVMQHLIWQINFEEQYMLMTTNEEKLSFAENSIVVPLSENANSHHLYASFRVNGDSSRITAMVDLGSNGVLSLKEKSLKKHLATMPLMKILGEGSKGIGSGKGNTDEADVLAQALVFDGTDQVFNNISIDIGPSKLNMLGLGFLDQFTVGLNWDKKEMILSPRVEKYDFIYSTYGLRTEFDEEKGQVVARSITEGTSAEAAGIVYQDQILAINEFEFNELADYCAYLSVDKGDTLDVRFVHEGEEREAKVIRSKLFDVE